MPPRFISRQLSHPSGLLGKAIRWLMNRSNAKMNEFAVQQLELSSSDRVLEIGFGGGVTLPTIINGAAFVGGIDHSKDVIEWAKFQYSSDVATGHADFRVGAVEAIPFGTAEFEKVCTVNTLYFWRSLDKGLEEIRRVLSPGDRVVIGFLPKEWMDRLGYPSDIFTSRTSDEVITTLTRTGFNQVRVARPEPMTRWNVIVATRGGDNPA